MGSEVPNHGTESHLATAHAGSESDLAGKMQLGTFKPEDVGAELWAALLGTDAVRLTFEPYIGDATDELLHQQRQRKGYFDPLEEDYLVHAANEFDRGQKVNLLATPKYIRFMDTVIRQGYLGVGLRAHQHVIQNPEAPFSGHLHWLAIDVVAEQLGTLVRRADEYPGVDEFLDRQREPIKAVFANNSSHVFERYPNNENDDTRNVKLDKFNKAYRAFHPRIAAEPRPPFHILGGLAANS